MEQVKIYASIIDDVTEQQINNLSKSDAYKDSIIRIMPDCHAGKGCTIGSVIQYTTRVVPNTVGVDIGCGMTVVELGDIEVDRLKLDYTAKFFIPSGFNVHTFPITQYDARWNAVIPKDKESYIQCSIGTLGGGNHFIELDIDDENNKYLVIHSGSRNLGVLICNYWQNVAISKLEDTSDIRNELITRLKAEGREKEISTELKKIQTPKITKELAYLEREDLDKYIEDMKNCQEYASLNRRTIANIICNIMNWTPINTFETIHNYIDVSNKIIRKGAVKAENNETLIIPMNMRDGSLLCKGKGNSDWLYSAPHGAGRIMSRAEARENIQLEDFKRSMHGIYTSTVCKETIDEAPMAYKPINIILQDIKDTVDIIKIIKPLWNFKATSKE